MTKTQAVSWLRQYMKYEMPFPTQRTYKSVLGQKSFEFRRASYETVIVPMLIEEIAGCNGDPIKVIQRRWYDAEERIATAEAFTPAFTFAQETEIIFTDILRYLRMEENKYGH